MGHIFRKRGESARCWKEGEPPPCEPPAYRGRAATGCEAALPRVSSTSVAARAPPSATGEEELLPSLLLQDQVPGPGLWAAAGLEPVTAALRAVEPGAGPSGFAAGDGDGRA